MPKERSGEGFQSAAGLVRYFDTESEKAPQIPAWAVIGMAVASGAIVLVLSYIWPM